MRKHNFSHSVVEHHGDGTHTIHHIHKKHGFTHNTPEKDGDVKGGAGSHDEMMDHMMDHTSQPNPGEANNEANMPMAAGGPVAGAAPAAVPGA